MDALPADLGQSDIAIVITASRLPGGEEAASSTTIDAERVERLGAPLAVDYLRLAPSVAVATSGPSGSLAEVRIRGAEANHTLLFVDGIRANDPAAGNIPRFELLNADIAGRIAVVRGPQSALWGSEAIGGVVAVDGDALGADRASVGAEAGSFGFGRASASGSLVRGDVGVAGAVAHQQAEGIDAVGSGGDRDGYRNSALRGLVRWQASEAVRLTVNGFHIAGRGQFDGFDPDTYLRADTSDQSRNRLTAGRVALAVGGGEDRWSGSLSASLLGSRNVNELAGVEQNWTQGQRLALDGQVNTRLTTGSVEHRFALAMGATRETFEADDTAFGGFTRQDRSRAHQSVTGEWRATWATWLETDVAVRRDIFNRFKDATSLRAAATVRPSDLLTLGLAYGEGIAQPSFFDLYGFFPGSFVGNPALKPERSRGWEASARLARAGWSLTLVGYRQRLKDEIVETFDFNTYLSSVLNSPGTSRRQGVEIEGAWAVAPWLRLSATYAWLDADQPGVDGRTRELRRPKHSGSVEADGAAGRWSYGASVAYVGARRDTDFDLFPAETVTLGSYWLAGARVEYRVHPRLALHARVANAFDDDYQDVVGYRTEGRSVFGGLRVDLGR